MLARSSGYTYEFIVQWLQKFDFAEGFLHECLQLAWLVVIFVYFVFSASQFSNVYLFLSAFLTSPVAVRDEEPATFLYDSSHLFQKLPVPSDGDMGEHPVQCSSIEDSVLERKVESVGYG